MSDARRWQVSDSAARKYELFVASWFAAWATDLVARAEIGVGWRVLDVACGTGMVARKAGPVVGATGEVVASDLNEGMLAEAHEHEVEGAPVQWRQADAQDLPFDDDAFDAVLCQQGLQFVPDKAAAVSEMRRVLRPGGVAAVSVWRAGEHNPYIAALAAGLRDHLSAEAGEVMLAPCGLGSREELADLFDAAGFASVRVDVVTLEREPVDPVEAISGNLAALPIADQIQAMDLARYDRMIDQILDELGDYIFDDKLHAPNSAHVAVGYA